MCAPFIVKPVVACGVSHSHSMALVLQPAALEGLQGRLPLPAVVQEFVNHGGMQSKVYVLGDKVGTLLYARGRRCICFYCSGCRYCVQSNSLQLDEYWQSV
jgi:hypothetical protein